MTAPNELSFLPEDYLEQKYNRRAMICCAVLALLVGGALFLWFQHRSKDHGKVEAEFNEVNNNYVEAARKIEQVKRMHEQQREVVHHAELAASLVERVPRSNMLAEITNALPVGVSLIDLSMTSAAHQAAAAPTPANTFAMHKAAVSSGAGGDGKSDALGLGTKPAQFDIHLKITGIARDDIQVAQLISRLSHNGMFADVNLIVSDTFDAPNQSNDKNAKGASLRRWQMEMMVDPRAEVREETKTAAVELSK
ncbi:MAG TPA: PilN domain-containing protein [Tepidisphaeraceae bacterium]